MGSLKFNDFSSSPTILLPTSICAFGTTAYPHTINYSRSYSSFFKHLNTPQSASSLTSTTQVMTTTPSKRKRCDYEATDDLLQALPPPSRFTLSSLGPKPIYNDTSMTGSLDNVMELGGTACQDFAPGSQTESTPRALLSPPSVETTCSFNSPTINNKTEHQEQLKTQILVESDDALTEADLSSAPARKARRREYPSSNELQNSRWEDATVSPKSCPVGPVIDNITIMLGVGWSRVNGDQDVLAAARGCARYIERHYPLSAVKIMLKSKALDASLVETREGYYLFQEDLNQGRLVSKNWDTCLANLRFSSEITFEGLETLYARRSPSPLSIRTIETNALLEITPTPTTILYTNSPFVSADDQMSLD